MTHRIVATAACAALATLSAAFTPVASAAARMEAGAAVKLPAELQYDGIRYMTGGVSSEEADAFKGKLHDYPLAIELVERQKRAKDDMYTAYAKVRITDRKGDPVFAAKAMGPFMLVRLEPGTYDVSATLDGDTLRKHRVVVVHGRTERATFVFPAGTD